MEKETPIQPNTFNPPIKTCPQQLSGLGAGFSRKIPLTALTYSYPIRQLYLLN